MPISRQAPPEHSQRKLAEALNSLRHIKTKHKRWMAFSPGKSEAGRELYPHAIYTVRLRRFLAGKPLSATLKKVGWIYFLRNRSTGLACGEVSMASGKHKNARLSEGPFVKKAFELVEKSNRDPRVGRGKHELRSLRVESFHLFCLWLRAGRGAEYFIPVTSQSAILRAGEWISRREFTKALRIEGHRIRAAQERMSRLLEERRS